MPPLPPSLSLLQTLEALIQENLTQSTTFWQTCLDAAQLYPEGLRSYMVGTANIRLDPLSPLASLVPVGLLEQQCIEASLLAGGGGSGEHQAKSAGS